MSEILSMDQVFLNRLTGIVLDNLANENFGVAELAKEAGMSRSNLHRKLRSITHRPVSQFIREIRLQHAMELLQQNAGTSAEIAYKVGFGSSTYFNKCFHEYYGCPPGEIRKRESETYIEKQYGEPSVPYRSDQQNKLKKSRKLLSGLSKMQKTFILAGGILIVLLLIFSVYSLFLKTSNSSGAGRFSPRDKSIVVLPFKNLSDDPNNQYFADGIMEDILNNLFQVSELRVISRTTSEHFLGSSLTAREVALKVNTRYVLEGSVRRYGDNTRISVQLIDAYNDQHLWSGNFDRELTDIIGIQSNIARQVALKLNTVLTDNEIRKIAKIPTRSHEAYDYYLRGRFLLNKAYTEQRSDIDKEGLTGSIQFFEKAIEADKNFAEAYASLADATLNLYAWGWQQPGIKGFLKARDLSMKALEIDSDCAEAHAVLGAYLIWAERRFEEGRKELMTSIRLNPNFSTAHQWYAQLLMITGPIEEARIYIDRALEIEPYFWVVQNLNAWIYYFEEEYDKAIKACFIARDLKPDFGENQWLFFLNYAKLGEGEKAVKELQSIATSYPGASQYSDEIMAAYNKSGIKGLFFWLIDINTHKPIPVEGMNGHPFFVAWWYAILDKKEESISWLEKNMESKMRLYVYFNLIATNPDFDILRSDPRFLAIIGEIGLTPYNKRPPK
jgi:TolB-like protein/AraC-like DNA-binding protein/Tfp pilus assembly protein PilF